MKTVLVTNDNLNSMFSLSDYLARFGSTISAIVVTSRLPGETSNVTGGLKMLWKSGWDYTRFKLLLNVTLPRRLRRQGLPTRVTDLAALMGHAPEILHCGDVNDPALLEKVRSHRPEILLSAGSTSIFKEELLAVPTVGAINLHSSLLPAYAGLATYFWCLLNDEPESGCTLHQITPALDGGPILDQAAFPMAGIRSVLQVVRLMWKANNDLLLRFFEHPPVALSGRAQDKGKRSYHSLPLKKTVRELLSKGKSLYTPDDIEATVAQAEKIKASLTR